MTPEVGLGIDNIAAVKPLRETAVGVETETGRRLQVLINNAGRIESTEGALWDVDPKSIKDVVDANVLGVALMINVFAPGLTASDEAARRSRRIIDLSSGAGAKGGLAYNGVLGVEYGGATHG